MPVKHWFVIGRKRLLIRGIYALLAESGRVVIIPLDSLRGRAVAARRAHNPEVLGSNPSPATKSSQEPRLQSDKAGVFFSGIRDLGLGIWTRTEVRFTGMEEAAGGEANIRTRLRFVVTFPFPDGHDRRRIWQKIFPPETPVENLDYERLVHFRLAGGSIHNTAMNASFLTAEAGTSVTMPLILRVIHTELMKSERLINDVDIVWEG